MRNMETIELLVNKLMIDETGGYTGKCNIITMEDVEMVDTAEPNTGDSSIRSTDEQMDTITMATGDDMEKELMMEDDVRMANTDLEEMNNMDTLPGVVVMLPEEEEGKEMGPGVVGDSQSSELGSVVGVERQFVDPHHYGSVHTPLLKPATILEKGL